MLQVKNENQAIELKKLQDKTMASIEKLGAKWIVHPINRIQRKEEKNGS
jgi:hypothetical protein